MRGGKGERRERVRGGEGEGGKDAPRRGEWRRKKLAGERMRRGGGATGKAAPPGGLRGKVARCASG